MAIWSTVETGIGIAASAAATLRPLFKAYFGSSHLAGNTSSNNWPRSGNSGYVQNKASGGEEYGLRKKVRTSNGVTTLIDADADERGEAGRGKFEAGGWDSQSKLRGGSDDDAEWRSGIMKTTGTTRTEL